MSKDIKNLKPQKGSRYKQGYFDVSASTKYADKTKPCIYRSSYEFLFMKWCERTSYVIKWISEPFELEYPCLETGRVRHYNVDFVVDVDKPEKWLIEVKPLKEVNDANHFGRIIKTITDPANKLAYVKANKIAAKNYSKWVYANKYCKERGYRFIIVTEKWLNKK